jgi:Tfp pilus assembly protein PilV
VSMSRKKRQKNIFSDSRGFSILEVLLGVTIFMIGMLGVTALNISSLKSNTFSGNMSEAVILAGDQIEELMAIEFYDPACPANNPECNPGWLLSDTNSDGTDQDTNENGLDDDHPKDAAAAIDGNPNFGLDDTGGAADHCQTGMGKNSIYDVCWNVAVGEPLPERTKTVNVIVNWSIKDVKRTISISTVILDHN